MSWQKDPLNVLGEWATRIPGLEVAKLRGEEFLEAWRRDLWEAAHLCPEGSPPKKV